MKKRNFFKSLIVVFVALVTLALAACGGNNANMVKLTWEVPSEAHISVDKMDKLPDQFEKGKTLVFEISCDEGFKVGNVKANGRRVAARGKRYNVIVKEETKIVVETKKEVSSLEITSKPAKLSYFAGEAVDPTGMVVTAKYADGTSVKVEKGAQGYKISPASFTGGETKFTVEYDGKKADVNLANAVEYKVLINTNGGKIKDSWINNVRAMGLNNFNVEENGNVSFSYYNNLPQNIKMPTNDEIEYEDHTFLGWSDGADITNQTNASKEISANWQAELLTVKKVYMVEENGVPYIVVEGNYRLADKVQLYLYEGNVNTGVKGDLYTNTNGKYSAFAARFDLTKLAEARTENGETLEGKWMDVRFLAEIDGKEESMEVYIGEGSGVEFDLNQKLQTKTQTYSFTQWSNYLKVFYQDTIYSYNVALEDVDGAEYIIISGKTLDTYKNMNIAISWFFQGAAGEAPVCTSPIKEDGSFKVMVPLSEVVEYTQGWAHVTIYKDDIEEPEFGNITTNLLISQCLTALDKLELPGVPLNRAVKFVAKNGVSYFLGTNNDGLMIYALDENKEISYDAFNLETIDGNVYYSVSGTYKAYTKEELTFKFDAQENGNMNGNWSTPVEKQAFQIIDIDEAKNTFTVKFNITELLAKSFKEGSADLLGFIIHMGTDTKFGDVLTGEVTKDIIVLDGIEYQIIRNDKTFSTAGIQLRKTTKADGKYMLSWNEAKLEDLAGKAVVTVTGTVMGFTMDDFNRVGFVKLGGDFAEFIIDGAKVTIEGNLITVVADVTDLEVNSYMTKLDTYAGQMQDLKLNSNHDEDGITIGNKHYRLTCKAGATSFEDFYGLLGLVVTNANN